MSRLLIGLDFETREFCRSEGPFPRPVCLSVSYEGTAFLLDRVRARDYLNDLFDREPAGYLITGHKLASFDMVVAALHYPELMPKIMRWFKARAISDTMIRERLLNMRRHGRLDYLQAPDGSSAEIGYGLVDLEKSYLGIDRSALKTNPDAWRTNYRMLENTPIDQWDAEARQYALDDAINTRLVWLEQEKNEFWNFSSEWNLTRMAFSLGLTTSNPMHLDNDRKISIAMQVVDDLSPEVLDPLYRAGVFARPVPPGPYAKGTIDKITGLPKIKAGSNAVLKRDVLGERVKLAYEALGEIPPMTESGGTTTKKDALAHIAGADPIIDLYAKVNYWKKIIDTDLPRMGDGTTPVYFAYDLPVETGRSCSFASWSITKNHHEGPIASANGQNIDPRMRPAFVSPLGWLILSVDFSSVELCSLCWRLLSLGFKSRLLDVLTRGWDAHGYLGAQIMANLEPWFQQYLQACNVSLLDFDAVYQVFNSLRFGEDKAIAERCEHFRKMAKPTGLGFPGGLGYARFVAYAKSIYGVDVTIEQAKVLKKIWFTIFPEMRQYFDYLTSNMRDPRFAETYTYTSPLGMVRSNAHYTAAANGAALQTPAAEGVFNAYNNVVEECYVHTADDVLFGCRPVNFLHDEGLLFIPDDSYAHHRAGRVQSIFVAGMSEILQGVPIKTEAVLSRRWSKAAKPVFNAQGHLIPWEEPCLSS